MGVMYYFSPRYKIRKANVIRGFFQNLCIFFGLRDLRFSFVSVQKNHTVGYFNGHELEDFSRVHKTL